MKVVTEALLRDELRNTQPDYYCIPEGSLLSPAAREYLQQRKIKILKEPPIENCEESEKSKAESLKNNNINSDCQPWEPAYIDFETGAFYKEKPEHMCQIHGNMLVQKCHPIILFRGKLDTLQTQIILYQSLIGESGDYIKLIEDLNSIIYAMSNIMRCEVLDEKLENDMIIGFTHKELHDRSHNPMKYFGIEQMVMPDYTMGKQYAMLNQLRAGIREVEVAAAIAFCQKGKCSRIDIMEELNRLSSALHVMMCKWLAGEYR